MWLMVVLWLERIVNNIHPNRLIVMFIKDDLLFYVFLLTSIGHLSRFIIGITPSAVALSRALNLHDSSICATSVRVLDNPN